MTNSPEINNTSKKDNDAGYYAVDARRVIQVFELFQMRPSHFSAGGKAGAQSVYYDARKIIENKTNNKWGHHTAKAIKNFCHFTQSENASLLPWQELIEHQSFYDGKEGAGRRTGNVLLAENRLQLNHQAMKLVRQHCTFSQQQLAEKVALPLRFIEVMEAGDWQTVAQCTAGIIADGLSVEVSVLFTQIAEIAEHKTDEQSGGESSESDMPENESGGVSQTTAPSESRGMNKVWLLVPVLGLIFWSGYQFNLLSKSSTKKPQQISQSPGSAPEQGSGKSFNTLSGCWDWSNGAYILIDADGSAHNGPFVGSWNVDDVSNRRYTLTWPSFVDTLSLSANGDVLSGKNNFNLPIVATRKAGAATELLGTWLWGNGITAVVQPDFTISGGSLKGTWRKAGANWIIEWPLVDSIILSADGQKLQVKNQFGSVTAKRDVSCQRN